MANGPRSVANQNHLSPFANSQIRKAVTVQAIDNFLVDVKA